MLRKSVLEKIVAVFSIFTLTFANFAFVTKSYAATFFETVFSNSKTDNENVVFDAYFLTEKEESYSVICAVQENATNLVANLKVLDSGYLKNPKLEIKPIDEQTGLSFIIDDNFEATDYIEYFEDNILELKQINSNTQLKFEIPFIYESKEYMNQTLISNPFEVELTGVYVNDRGKEIEINKSIPLKINWKDDSKIELNSEIEKYVPFEYEKEKGVVLQTKVTLESKNQKTLPIENIELEIDIPKIGNANLEKINILPKQLSLCSEKSIDEIELTDENWSYDENKLKIFSKNLPNEENMYYNSPGINEYIITYVYKNIEEFEPTIKTKIKTAITILGDNQTQYEVEKEFEYNVEKQINDIVTYEIQNETENILKGYMYLNYNNPETPHEIEYELKHNIDISYKDLIEKINLETSSNYYITKQGEILENNDLYFKTIKISKSNFEKMLGEDGLIEIQNQNGAVIAKFTKATLLDENENYTYNFENEDNKKLNIKISKPISEGNILLTTIKAQKQTGYNKLEYKEFDYINSISKIKTKYNHLENITESSNIETKTKLEDTITKADLSLSTNKFSLLEPTKVEFKIQLNNHLIKSDIYGNSIFEIKLPEYVENFEIKDYNMLYGDGLNITSVETIYNDSGGLSINATIEGLQKDISSGSFTDGTNIIINGEISINENAPPEEQELVLTYTNQEATNYYEDGIATNKIIYSSFINPSKIETSSDENQESEVTIDVSNIEETEKITEQENLNLQKNKYKITGTVFIDKNSDGIKNETEETKSDVKVILVDTGQAEKIISTDENGKYEFTDLEKGKYTVIFEYDSTKYSLTSFENKTSENNSKVIYSEIELDGEKFDGAVTDVIEIEDSNITNINMGLVENKIFDLQLTKTVSKITIRNEEETTITEYEDTKLAKAEISSNKIDNSSAYIEYILKIENKGDVEGYAKSIVDYIPQDLEFNPALNPDWYQDEDGNIYTQSLENKPIPVGGHEELKLILTKKLNEHNAGITNTSAEIIETYNVYGLENKKRKSANSIESNLSSADVVITEKKGEVFIYTSIILTTILLSGIVIFLMIYRLKFLKRKEGGV
ncbi:MAG: hypothetical protein J6J60_01145 [Clostridia bacterium]|nr:hypothetical protein [Clostridia bacterium]